MANLTLAIDDELLRRARIRALEQGTSVNELVRSYLAALADTDDVMAARLELVELAKQAASGSGPKGRTWTRDDIYDRPYPGRGSE